MMILVSLRHGIKIQEFEAKQYPEKYEAFSMDLFAHKKIIHLRNTLTHLLRFNLIGENAKIGVVKGSTISQKFIQYVQEIEDCIYIYIYI